jgi:hypothetical protein|tara:strand:+ start:177 stop:944 length:768 start_codon:yes stop_codon:yes gene_type:complete
MENFGNIKDTFKNIVVESVLRKDKEGKKVFSKFLKTLKENKTLSDQYLIYKNLQTKKFDDGGQAREYIKENITLLRNLNEGHIQKGNDYFLKLLKGVKIIKENDSFYNDISYLTKTKKTPSNIDKLNTSTNNIVRLMLEKEDEVVVKESLDIPPSIITKLAVDKFNNRYSNISESEKEIIKTILNGNDEDKLNTFIKLKKGCIETIDKKLDESSDIDLKDKLLRVKDKLLNMVYNKEDSVNNISSVYELKESISN